MAIAQFSGLASGIDSASLIDAIIEARESTNELRRQEIDFLNSENEALDELNTKILALSDLLDRFRTANGGGVSKKSSSSDSSVATAAVSASANNATLSLNVTSIASAATASFNDVYAASTSAFASHAVGTQTIGVDIGTGGDLVSVDVNITSATTVQEYVDAFNANSNAAGRATASIVNVGTTASPSYRVVITSLKTGTELGTIAFDIPTGAAGFGGNSDLQNRTVDQATNAAFTLSGISTAITRATNSISDVITGVTFNLAKTGTADITISDDADTTADLFSEIVDAYNDIVAYVNENDTITRSQEGEEVTNVYGSLAKAEVDDDFLSQFRTALAAVSADSGTSVTSFAELGLSTNRDGTLTLDTEKFKTAVGSDPVGAAEVLTDFADDAAGVSGFMYQFTTFNGFIDIVQNSNSSEIDSLNDRIDQLERYTAKLREQLQQQFARLESLTGQMQSMQQALTGILASLG